ncbi:MAG: M23 family metallopeptidase [Xanthobacteraceae bacterium]
MHRAGVHHYRDAANRTADQGRPRPDRQPHHARGSRPSGDDYMLAHAGRQVRLGPVAFWIGVGTLVVMGVWSIGTATYFAFHDDVLTRLIAHQAEMQFAYEDRISDLRAQVDRIVSRQLLDQEQFEQKLEQIVRRQTTLEQRASTLNSLTDPTITGSIKPGGRINPSNESPATAPRPSPISDTVTYVAPPDREARLESRAPATLSRTAANHRGVGVDGALARLQSSLDRIEVRQSATLNAIEESFDSRAHRMRRVITDLGLELDKTAIPAGSPGPMGGPFVAVKLRADSSGFERQLYRISLARAQVERLSRSLVFVPVRKPLVGEIDTTSTFGMRADPFLHALAMHTGLDFRGNMGDPIHATAAGTVTQAGWSGGYGKMVEVDHGNGLATRYGHLSAIDVVVGQKVQIGQTVGRLGSTGRSTGPHLHYETRIDGEAVDPQKFLRAGLRLSGAAS